MSSDECARHGGFDSFSPRQVGYFIVYGIAWARSSGFGLLLREPQIVYMARYPSGHALVTPPWVHPSTRAPALTSAGPTRAGSRELKSAMGSK